MSQRIQIRRGLSSDLLLITPAEGEPCWTTDTLRLYIGDGSTAGGNSIGKLGDVIGPAGATDTAIAIFDTTTGKLLKNSLVTLSSSGAFGFPAGVKQTFAPNTTTSGLNVGSFAGVPSVLANGDLFYDSTANTLKARINGATVALGDGGGTVNSGTANQLAYYASTGTAVSGLTSGNSSILVTSASGVPSISAVIPNLTVKPASGSATWKVLAPVGQLARILFAADNDSPATTEVGTSGAANQILTGSADGDLCLHVNANSQRILFGTTTGIGLSLESANAGVSWAGSTSGILPMKSNLNMFPASGTATLYVKAAAGQSARILFQANNDVPGRTEIGTAGATNGIMAGSMVGDLCFGVNGSSQNMLFSVDETTIALKIVATTNQISLPKTTASTSTTTGSLINAGGFGNAGDAFFGSTVNASGGFNGTLGATTASSALVTTLGASGLINGQLATGGEVLRLQSLNTVGVYLRFSTSAGARGFIGTADQIVSGGSVNDIAVDGNAGKLLLSTAGGVRATVSSTGLAVTGALSVDANVADLAANITQSSSSGYGLRVKAGNNSLYALGIVNAANSSVNIQMFGDGRAAFAGAVISGTGTFNPAAGSTDGAYLDPAAGLTTSGTVNQLYLRRRSSDGNIAQFYRDTSVVGSISVSTIATLYNTSSDKRLKTNIRVLPNSGAIIDALKPSLFDWKTGEKNTYGFIAQEVYAVFPQAVTKGDTGKKVVKQWAMDAGKLMPVVVAELNDLRSRVFSLERTHKPK